MAISTRQSSLLVSEDWTKAYQTFRNADFQSYDFETLRKSMIDYLRLYYPEDFNDFVESSEFIALIDLIAFLGQSLAFRTDLNARENFIDTAQRRDSILKLARLISYNPKRNIPASGFLKIDSVSTTESLTDSNGLNLSGLVIEWNDGGNDNWLEQFTTVLNATTTTKIGRPSNSQTINSIKNDEYRVNLVSGLTPVFPFETSVEGITLKFEAVSPTSANQSFIYEDSPRPNRTFNLLYKNDSLGNSSLNTGWFLYVKQGELQSIDFNLSESIPNRVYSVNVDNINNSDLWLYSLDSSGNLDELWKEVPAVAGVNIIFNTDTNKNVFQVNSRANDQVDLVFGDGSFANIPQGNYRLYYRVSNGLSYKVTPDEMQGVIINVNYTSQLGRVETLTLRASLQYTIANATARESIEEIREKAPQAYYTQNRMITGEDYNLLPYTLFNSIQKIKAVNRTSSGVSRYLDVIDTTGKYSSTNIFAEDGIIYRDPIETSFSFDFLTTTDIYRLVFNDIKPILSKVETKQFFYSYYPKFGLLPTTGNIAQVTTWQSATVTTNGSTGYFKLEGNAAQIGSNVASNSTYIREGAIVKFCVSKTSGLANAYATVSGGNVTAVTIDTLGSGYTVDPVVVFSHPYGIGAKGKATVAANGTVTGVTVTNGGWGYNTAPSITFVGGSGYFDSRNNIVSGTPSLPGDKQFIYSSVVNVAGDGTASGAGTFSDGTGAVTINSLVPTNAVAVEVFSPYNNDFSSDVTNTILDYIESFQDFGLRYDFESFVWKVITPSDLSTADFNLRNSGISNDSSWLIKFNAVGKIYTITYRGLDYIFESVEETNFYFDNTVKIYDQTTGFTINDQINVLKVNNQPDNSKPIGLDYVWYVNKSVIEVDGFENPNKINITYSDINSDGVPDNPEIFETIVEPDTNRPLKNVFYQQTTGQDQFVVQTPIDAATVVTEYSTLADINFNKTSYTNGQLFYIGPSAYSIFYPTDYFYQLTVDGNIYTVSQVTGYTAKRGRQELYFQYRHNSPNYRRIDPSPNNIVDLYILTKQYAQDYVAWIQDTTSTVTEPDIPSSEDLNLEYNSLEGYKSISDTLIYNPARFKPIFGDRAEPSLRATFKVVKNNNVNITDSDVKTSVIAAINNYFDPNNWDFGETFYFSELSAYLHSVLAPNIASIIIVPSNSDTRYGALQQINADFNEIIVSAATVDNVEIISAITAAQLNQTISA